MSANDTAQDEAVGIQQVSVDVPADAEAEYGINSIQL